MEALGYVVANLPFFTRQQQGTLVGQTLLYNPSKKISNLTELSA